MADIAVVERQTIPSEGEPRQLWRSTVYLVPQTSRLRVQSLALALTALPALAGSRTEPAGQIEPARLVGLHRVYARKLGWALCRKFDLEFSRDAWLIRQPPLGQRTEQRKRLEVELHDSRLVIDQCRHCGLLKLKNLEKMRQPKARRAQ